LVCFS